MEWHNNCILELKQNIAKFVDYFNNVLLNNSGLLCDIDLQKRPNKHIWIQYTKFCTIDVIYTTFIECHISNIFYIHYFLNKLITVCVKKIDFILNKIIWGTSSNVQHAWFFFIFWWEIFTSNQKEIIQHFTKKYSIIATIYSL